MDQEIRNKLRNVVTRCRKLLEDSVSQELEGKYAIFARKDHVTADPSAVMTHLSDEERAARKDILDHYEHIQARGFKEKEALDQLIREVAFTHLNRLCAYKMMEAREVHVGGRKFREAVSRGVNSNGVKFYLAEHPEEERLFKTGHQDIAYQRFLDWLGGALSGEIGVLFNPNDPANRLYPRQKTLDEVLDLLNGGGIKAEETEQREQWPGIWSQDETIGWVYQYFTPKELRDKARKESQAPRNSYELAFRNQFFTPRYVVEFLTDNTLGRAWYEMREGDTKLKDQCRYMVRRPTEIFLKEGEQPPKDAAEGRDDLSQEELLKLPVHVPYRAKKDPRELKILDPACGSGHFLLYCFDLLLTIYEEAHADPDLGPALREDYPTLDALKRDVPRLILAHNLHGVDIDLRASQIAALALWLRCQRAHQEMGLKNDRPPILKSNIVCAEPMPGEKGLLDEFLKTLREDRLESLIRQVMNVPEGQRVRATSGMVESLADLVRAVWDKMRLAGEAGSLLKIEEELRTAIREGQDEWEEDLPLFRFTVHESSREPTERLVRFVPGDVEGETVTFWDKAEALVRKALDEFAGFTSNGGRFQRQLFAEDAQQGLGFIDVCRQSYDVILMNPPFGLGLRSHTEWLKKAYPDGYVDMFSSFICRAAWMCRGKVGIISSRSILMTKKLQRIRASILVPGLETLADLGWPVMDGAMVQSCAYVYDARGKPGSRFFLTVDRRHHSDKGDFSLGDASFKVNLSDRLMFSSMPQQKLLYDLPGRALSLLKSPTKLGQQVLIAKLGMKSFNDFRFLRLRAEVSPEDIGEKALWEPLSKGGPYALFHADLPLLVKWCGDGEEVAQENVRANGQTAQARQASKYYRLPGGTYSRRAKDFGVRVLPAGCIIGEKGPVVLPMPGYSIPFVIGLLNSRLINKLVHVQANAKQFDSGIIEALPWVDFDPDAVAEIETLTCRCISSIRDNCSHDETDSLFTTIPGGTSLAEVRDTWLRKLAQCRNTVAAAKAELNRIVDEQYGIDSATLARALDSDFEEDNDGDEDDEDQPQSIILDSIDEVTRAVISYSLGICVGRWDLRLYNKTVPSPEPSTIFQPIPRCQPGLLQESPGYQAKHAPEGYPVAIDGDGILADDPDHPDDLIRRVRDVLEVIWKDRAEAVEREACEILGVKDLRDYFRKPGAGGFWDDHVKRYSKSRRKAPIYWLLQSSKKNYALWVYYHRLDKDLLFKALLNYVEPKIRLETSRLESLNARKAAAGDGGKETKRLAKEVEKQEDLLSELRDFEDKLRRAANLHLDPDLNDGVVLNIAPLRELVPWREAKKYWDELMEGKYEWSSIGKQLREKGLVKC